MAETRKPRTEPGGLESLVLGVLWDQGPLTTPEVHARIGQPRQLAYTTILTVLQRLMKKGLVTRDGGGRSHVYRPSISRTQHTEAQARRLAETLLDLGDVGVAAFLVEAHRLDPEMLDELRRRLGEAS